MATLGIIRQAIIAAAALLLVIVTGCSQNPYFAGPGGVRTAQAAPTLAPGAVAPWQNPGGQAVSQVEARLSELSRRVQLLDDNNRQLHTQLAQSEQQTQVYQDEAELLRKQLGELSQRFESTAIAARDAENRVRGMQASTQIRGSASITPNTNLSQLAGRLNLGGLPVTQDGRVIRIALPSDQMFQPGTAQLIPQAAMLLDPIAGQLRTIFPRQRIGIEGYTDQGAAYGGAGSSNAHQLTGAQAAAVLDLLTRRAGMPSQQLFTVAQGANNPRQTNESAAGRAANRRIELVIYPETF
ncbi:MAG: OmpA family protein [Rubripirellula sp.]